MEKRPTVVQLNEVRRICGILRRNSSADLTFFNLIPDGMRGDSSVQFRCGEDYIVTRGEYKGRVALWNFDGSGYGNPHLITLSRSPLGKPTRYGLLTVPHPSPLYDILTKTF